MDLFRLAEVRFLMRPHQSLRLLASDAVPGFAEKRVHKQSSTHPDPAVDTPDRELNARFSQRFPPSQHVLIHAVDQRAVKIE